MLLATTKLEAVNIILSSIGADPVNTLDEDADVDVANALRMLTSTSRNIQRKGWDFNKGAYTFTPDVWSKKIKWNETIISFEPDDGGQYSSRGGYLYDMANQTDKFEKPVTGTVTVALDFEDLPDSFRNYIALRAAVDYQMQYLADGSVSQDLQMQLADAHADIVEYDLRMGSYNMLQLTSIANVLERT